MATKTVTKTKKVPVAKTVKKTPVAVAPVAASPPAPPAPPAPPKPKNEFPEVNMPCQRGKDLMTKGSSCDSKRAWNMSPHPGGRQATFKCIKCKHQWTVSMGGTFNGA